MVSAFGERVKRGGKRELDIFGIRIKYTQGFGFKMSYMRGNANYHGVFPIIVHKLIILMSTHFL